MNPLKFLIGIGASGTVTITRPIRQELCASDKRINRLYQVSRSKFQGDIRKRRNPQILSLEKINLRTFLRRRYTGMEYNRTQVCERAH